jgi:hypothetical protein
LMWSCNCNLYVSKHLCTSGTVEWGRCNCLLAVWIDLHGLHRNVCLLCSSSSLDVLGCLGDFWFKTLPVSLRHIYPIS